MADSPSWIALFALGISLGTLIASWAGVRITASKDYVGGLRDRLDDAAASRVQLQDALRAHEIRIEECEAERTRLREEQVDLLRRIRRLENHQR